MKFRGDPDTKVAFTRFLKYFPGLLTNRNIIFYGFFKGVFYFIDGCSFESNQIANPFDFTEKHPVFSAKMNRTYITLYCIASIILISPPTCNSSSTKSN